jgi:hypothetical protein
LPSPPERLVHPWSTRPTLLYALCIFLLHCEGTAAVGPSTDEGRRSFEGTFFFLFFSSGYPFCTPQQKAIRAFCWILGALTLSNTRKATHSCDLEAQARCIPQERRVHSRVREMAESFGPRLSRPVAIYTDTLHRQCPAEPHCVVNELNSNRRPKLTRWCLPDSGIAGARPCGVNLPDNLTRHCGAQNICWLFLML